MPDKLWRGAVQTDHKTWRSFSDAAYELGIKAGSYRTHLHAELTRTGTVTITTPYVRRTRGIYKLRKKGADSPEYRDVRFHSMPRS